MRTEGIKVWKRWPAAVLVATVMGACGPVAEELPEAESLGEAQQTAVLNGVSLGLNPGAIYSGVEQPLSSYSEQVFCEFSNLGAKWIRIELPEPEALSSADKEMYKRIAQKAKAKNIKVLVTVPARYCHADSSATDIATYLTDPFVADLSDLATNVFTGESAVDGYEIGTKVNLQDQGCGDGVTRYRVSPNAFGALLRAAWNWKTSNARTELIVAGSVVNTFVTSTSTIPADPYWSPFLNSSGLKVPAGTRPFDFFGIQPYNNAALDYNCINTGSSTCFTSWKYNVRSGLTTVASRLNTATGTTGTKLFATEFGFQLAICNNKNCVLNSLQQTAAMQAAGDAIAQSGVTPHALWTSYRDSTTEHFGLRDDWDATTGTYPARETLWAKFKNMSGHVAGNNNVEACWVPGEYFNAGFESGDTQRTTMAGDWAYGYYKGECAPGERMMGLSRSIASNWARVGLCYKDPLDSGRYGHEGCTAVAVDTAAGPGDWASGNFKAECGANQYVAGFAQSQSHDLSYVLCCPATVSGSSCESVVFAGADNRETLASGNWDADGYKGECGVGRYVAGVSRTADGDPHGLLCCAQ